jgi:hypothetical protein
MRLNTTYEGAADPFEGDRTLWLAALPAEATVLRAALTVRPSPPPPLLPPPAAGPFSAAGTRLSARLGRRRPFWRRVAELGVAMVTPDFADELNAYLSRAPVSGGYYRIPFVLRSNRICGLDVALTVDYVIDRRVLPPYIPSLNLTYGFEATPWPQEPLVVLLPRSAVPLAGSSARVAGEFAASRVAMGPVDPEPPEVRRVVVSTEQALAQPFRPEQGLTVTAVDLALQQDEPGELGLTVSIAGDDDGKPSATALAQAPVPVAGPSGGRPSWCSADLPAQLRLEAGVRYWVIVQSQQGRAFWRAVAATGAEPPLQAGRYGGLAWRPAAGGSLAARFRLRHVPERFTIPIRLQVGNEPRAAQRTLGEFAPLGRVDFCFDFAPGLARALAFERGDARGDELLVNGSFEDPEPADAARRLFGFDAARGAMLCGLSDLSRTVDLSRQSELCLAFYRLEGSGDHLEEIEVIDCAGTDPRRTTLREVVAAINRAVRAPVAGGSGGRLALQASGMERDGAQWEVELRPWLDASPPQGWRTTLSGNGAAGDDERRILRRRWPPVAGHPASGGTSPALPPERIVAQLETARDRSLALRQTVAVDDRREYVLRFHFLPLQPAGPLPEWQVRWLDAAGRAINGDDGASRREETALLQSVDDPARMWSSVEVHLRPPSGAARAELGLVQPAGGAALVDSVSLRPALQVLVNPNFRTWLLPQRDQAAREGEYVSLLPGWAALSGLLAVAPTDLPLGRNDPRGALVFAEGDSLIAGPADGAAGLWLGGEGPEDAVLAQGVSVRGGEAYTLVVRGRPFPTAVDEADERASERRGRVELHWLPESSGAPVLLPLDGQGFSEHAWCGAAPVGAERAEIRLVQPAGGGSLLVERVAFTAEDRVAMPLVFLAEAPGALDVSDLHVVYDELPLAEPEPPPATLPPALIRRVYDESALAAVNVEAPPEPQAGVVDVSMELEELPPPMEPTAAAADSEPTVAEAEQPSAEVDAGPALTEIHGLSPRRLESLIRAGIDSVARLAVAAPEDVASALLGGNLETARTLIERARALLETAAP